jgi:hypothetical protein
MEAHEREAIKFSAKLADQWPMKRKPGWCCRRGEAWLDAQWPRRIRFDEAYGGLTDAISPGKPTLPPEIQLNEP